MNILGKPAGRLGEFAACERSEDYSEGVGEFWGRPLTIRQSSIP